MIRPALVTPVDAATLQDVDPKEVVAALAADGVVHFQGFDSSEQAFADFSDRFSSDFTCDPYKIVANPWNGTRGNVGRVVRRIARAAQRVRARNRPVNDASPARFAPFSGYGLNPHNENCFLPGAFPDLVWFHCSRPADSGGATLLLDGGELLKGLDARTATFLRDEPVRYTTSLVPAQWQATWEVRDRDQLRDRLDSEPGTSYELSAAGHLEVTFDSTQVFSSNFGDGEVVRTNLLSRQPFDRVDASNTEALAGGGNVPGEIVSALLDGARARSELDLAPGDVILIDNSRVMHGRTPFADERRRITTRCAWLRPELTP